MTDSAKTAQGLTEAQRHILAHSLGLTYGKDEYRNHFVTGEGSTDYPNCMALVEIGLMFHRRGSELTGGDDLFIVTDTGKSATRAAMAMKLAGCER